ncbi:winged helix-turn-helix domain-containing protein [Aquimarina sp. TRL1]|uniref:winged helix-turn-helix domain-containing protein n=1 Tax=Aquimarina sp. (strain TRL1) TaxID=2736252 RepID=UPI00158E40FC|nr:helix-turn-helix domain-containing protein [Aquimarina sp. TRL1]QKX03623.1 winged helix-turn-helix domain-containing protein [Aquimarina sp. TRL1]
MARSKEPLYFSEIVKVALRDVGNQLLLSDKDSISLISPIIQINEHTYELSFEADISIVPDTLVANIRHSFEKLELPERYIVEVINCSNKEVSYSYRVMMSQEESIIPCLGRRLPYNCYRIRILFIEETAVLGGDNVLVWASLCLISIAGIGFLYVAKKKNRKNNEASEQIRIGKYSFYPDKNFLEKEGRRISLTTKERELMQLFSQHQNETIKREVLVKEVWEDQGVIVGRSLDAFISRLRKKLQDDPSVNIINIHGVGYKLEVL